MMNENEVHVYHRRNVQHVFIGDTYAGIYTPAERTIRCRESMRVKAAEIQKGFQRLNGIPVTVLCGDDELAKAAPLMEFPAEVKALMTPELGERTPEVIAWAGVNWPADEFRRRYPNDEINRAVEAMRPAPVETVEVEESASEEQATPETPSAVEPEKPRRGRPPQNPK